ncbi:MAG: hypothetical protein GY757_18830 [bacterium]|nr:hypothetical protein [bacterium]
MERIKKDIEETKQLLEAANWDYDEIADYKLEAYIEDYEALAEQREKDAEHLARTEEENARILERKLKEQLEIRKAFIEKMNKMPVEYYAAEYEDDVYIDAEIRTRKYRMSNADYWNQEDEAPGHYEDSANTYEDAMVNAFENVGDAYVDMLSDMDGNWKDMVASMSVTISKVFSSEVIDATVGEGMQDIIKRFKAGDQTWGDYAAAAGMAGVLLSRFIGNKNERMRVNAAGTGAVTGAGWGSKMGGNSGGGGWATAIGAIIGAIAGYIGTEKQKDWKQYITPEHQGWYDMGRGIQDISEMTQKRGGDDRTRIAIVAGIDSMREGMYNQAQIIAESVPVEFRQALMESIGSAEFGMGGKGWVIRQSHQIEDMEALMEAVQKSMWEAIGPQLIEGATSMIDGFDASRMSAGSPIAGLIESVQAGVQDGNIDQYIKDLMELTQAINDADMAWETITESIDKVLNGSTAYENALDSLDLKYEEYEEALVNLGFSAEAIAEIMANKALEIDELERVFAEDRANITSEIDYYIAGLTDTMSNLEKEIFQVDQSFDSWIDRMEELGASEEDLALIEAKRIQVIQALAEAQLDMIRQTQSEIGGYDQDHRLRQIGGRYGWGDEYYSEEGGANWENIFRDAIQGFVTGSAAQIVQTADRFGVTIEQLIGDITWLNDVIEEMRAEMQALIDSIKANLDQVRNSMEYANWQGTPQAFYMQNIKSAMGAESFSLEDLLSISDDLVDWWNAAIQQEIMVAQQWGQVASITESLINSIDAVIKSIKYSSLNVALPGQKADLAGQDYATLRAAAFGPDATQEDLQAFINFTQTFLQQQQNAFKSSDEYQRVYAEVMRDLGLAQDLVQTEDFQKKIYEQLVEMTENVDFSDIKSTFDEIADWIEAQISEIEKGIMITVGFEGLDEDAATALGLLEGIVAEHGWNASLTLDFITNFLAGNTEILWREFRDLLEDMGADSSTVKMIEAIYNDQASSFTWEELNNLLETEGIQPDIITRLRGEYQNDGLSLTELEDILASGGLPNEVIRRIVAELKTDVEVEVSPQFTAINERLKDIRDNTKETYLRLSGNQSGQYRSINSKLASIMSSASRIASNTSNIGAFASSSNYAPMIVGRDNTEKDELKKQTAILEAMLDKPMQVTVEVGGEEFETLIDRRADRVVVKREQGGYSDGRKML